MNNRQAHQRPARRHGFTIMELMIVVAIVLIVMGLLLAGAAQLRKGSQASQTRAMLGGLEGISVEYQVKTTQAINHGIRLDKNGNVRADYRMYDWDNAKPFNVREDDGTVPTPGQGVIVWGGSPTEMDVAKTFSERFVFAVWQMPELQAALKRLGESAITDKDESGDPGYGFLEIRDPWGNPIAYVQQVDHNDSFSGDDFLPEYDRPYFASAGADGLWGSTGSTATGKEKAQAADNLYSFDLDRSQAPAAGN